MNPEIRELVPALLPDYLDFFDHLEFEQHPGWKICYCYSYHFTGTPEEWEIPGRNREKVKELILAGRMHGFLAYLEGKPVGWVHADDKNNLERLKLAEELQDSSGGKTLSVVCFVISPRYRRKGVATRLLERVCGEYRDRGYDYIEAYPEDSAQSEEENYNGPKSLYEKNGFRLYRKAGGFSILRKSLSGKG